LAWAVLQLGPFSVGFSRGNDDNTQAQEDRYEELERQRRHYARKKNENLRKAQQMTRSIINNQYRLSVAKQNLRHHQSELQVMRGELETLSSQLDETIGVTARLNQDVAQRIRQIYMGGRVSLLQMIMESTDLATFLDSLYYKQRVVSNDKDMLTALGQRMHQLEYEKNRLSQQKVRIYGTIENIKKDQDNYSRYIRRDSQQREKYQKDAAYYERAEREILRESSAIQRQLERLTNNKESQSIVSTGHFTWPVTGAQITSNFGYRRHPIHRKRLMHTGLDLAKPRGTPVKAADSGNVIEAGWRGGYGRVVMINHGNRNGRNIVTLYGHLDATSVGQGQSVVKGQTVGRVGSTGYSTGPHLHFEVRENGRPVNPLNYLP